MQYIKPALLANNSVDKFQINCLISLSTDAIYTVSQKRHPCLFLWYLCDIFVRFHPILLIFGKTHPQKIETNTCARPIHASFYVFTVPCENYSDASERTLPRRPLPVRCVFEPECRNFLKILFKLLTLQPLSEKNERTFYPQKHFCQNAYFSVAWLLRNWYGLHQRVIGEAIDHGASVSSVNRILWTGISFYQCLVFFC